MRTIERIKELKFLKLTEEQVSMLNTVQKYAENNQERWEEFLESTELLAPLYDNTRNTPRFCLYNKEKAKASRKKHEAMFRREKKVKNKTELEKFIELEDEIVELQQGELTDENINRINNLKIKLSLQYDNLSSRERTKLWRREREIKGKNEND